MDWTVLVPLAQGFFLALSLLWLNSLWRSFYSVGGACADRDSFQPALLADDPASVADLSDFENGQEVPPGTYRVDIYLNDGFITTRDVTFNLGEKVMD